MMASQKLANCCVAAIAPAASTYVSTPHCSTIARLTFDAFYLAIHLGVGTDRKFAFKGKDLQTYFPSGRKQGQAVFPKNAAAGLLLRRNGFVLSASSEVTMAMATGEADQAEAQEWLAAHARMGKEVYFSLSR